MTICQPGARRLAFAAGHAVVFLGDVADQRMLANSGSPGGRAFRDLGLEKEVHALTQRMGIGAQFGGKYFCHDVRVIRLPRHGASCPVGLGVSCSADRQALGKITADGVFLEELERDPSTVLRCRLRCCASAQRA